MTLGVKFQSDRSGNITAIRFYKGPANTGTHVGSLWTTSGTLLGSVTFTGETASGWQQMLFPTPIPIVANTVYIASYFAPVGHYPGDDNFFAAAGVDNPPLHALSNGTIGERGLQVRELEQLPGSDLLLRELLGRRRVRRRRTRYDGADGQQRVAGSGAKGVSPSGAVTAVFSEPMDAATISHVDGPAARRRQRPRRRDGQLHRRDEDRHDSADGGARAELDLHRDDSRRRRSTRE